MILDNEDFQNIQRFYELLAEIEQKIGGKRCLEECDGYMDWPERGIYFFFEAGEIRTTSGAGLRCVRVGTHALKKNSKTTLWKRLRQHRGTTGGRYPGSGNHRGSVFRLHVGTALMNQDDWPQDIADHWGGSNAPRSIKRTELPYERVISEHIRTMQFLWLEIDDEPGPNSLRGYIERNSIALLSNFHRTSHPIDPPSPSWLGLCAQNPKIRESGLWNVNHVDQRYDNRFLATLNSIVSGI